MIQELLLPKLKSKSFSTYGMAKLLEAIRMVELELK